MSDMTLSADQVKLIRQWFDSVQDLSHPDYLEPQDYQLASAIYRYLGMRVPNSIASRISPTPTGEA